MPTLWTRSVSLARFMPLVEGLGWRVSAICRLRACDVDRKASGAAPHGRIFKNPEADKEGSGGWLPIARGCAPRSTLCSRSTPGICDWPLFPAPRAKTNGPEAARVRVPGACDRPTETPIPKPWSRYHARKLLERAEAKAKLPALAGSDFHAYRRKWATERKHLPAQDVAAAGNWRDLRARAHAPRGRE